MVRIRFGPAGKPLGFKGGMEKVPAFLASVGLNALEYEAVRGVNIREEKARLLGEEARKHGVVLSMHAPYYINLASEEEKVIGGSKRRLIEALRASEWMHAYIVVFHPGYYKDLGREEALRRVVKALQEVWMEASSLGISYPLLGAETTGKQSQVGSLEDIAEICSKVERCRPVVDWAHLHARAQGEFIRSKEDVAKVIDFLENSLGSEALKPLHQHFSRIEYGKGGEKQHHPLHEKEYGPEFEHVCSSLLELGVDSVIISESPLLDRDALVMKKICREKGYVDSPQSSD